MKIISETMTTKKTCTKHIKYKYEHRSEMKIKIKVPWTNIRCDTIKLLF